MHDHEVYTGIVRDGEHPCPGRAVIRGAPDAFAPSGKDECAVGVFAQFVGIDMFREIAGERLPCCTVVGRVEEAVTPSGAEDVAVRKLEESARLDTVHAHLSPVIAAVIRGENTVVGSHEHGVAEKEEVESGGIDAEAVFDLRPGLALIAGAEDALIDRADIDCAIRALLDVMEIHPRQAHVVETYTAVGGAEDAGVFGAGEQHTRMCPGDIVEVFRVWVWKWIVRRAGYTEHNAQQRYQHEQAFHHGIVLSANLNNSLPSAA